MISSLASAVIPGLGQLRNGQRTKGIALVAATVVVAAVAAFMVWRRQLTLLTWGVQPTALGWLIIGNGALFAMRTFAAADAYANSRDRVSTRPAAMAGSALLGVFIAGILVIPHAVAG